MRLDWVLDPEEERALREFFNALDKHGFKYEHVQERFLIKIKGYIDSAYCVGVATIRFKQDKDKRVNVSHGADYIEVTIFSEKKPIPIRVKFPKSWRIQYEKPYLKIFY